MIAASRTVRAIGPTLSWLGTPGMTPPRPTSPTVGFTPTTQFAEAGSMIEPLVSVPMPATHRPAATATPVPELDSFGERSSL